MSHAPNESFEDHARQFLKLLPVARNWSVQQEKIVRTTIENTLIPAFGHLPLKRVSPAAQQRFEQTLRERVSRKTGRPLSVFRINNIMRLLRQILSCDLDQIRPLPGEVLRRPPLTRIKSEREQWLTTLQAFKEHWAKRTDDYVRYDHPHASWVYRQRKQAKNNKMPEWKLQQLQAIGFPFDAASSRHRATNLGHAKALLDFYQSNGHCAPTITHGGAALTHWVRRMGESQGTQGIKGDSEGSAQLAAKFLQEHIPGFTWGGPSKSEVNKSRGLSHNGYAPPRGCGERVQEIMERAAASLRHGPCTVVQKGVSSSVFDFLVRARNLGQATRVHLVSEDRQPLSAAECLVKVVAGPGAGQMTLHTKPWVGEGAGAAYVIGRCLEMGYIVGGSHYAGLLATSENGASMVMLDYDAHLADQTHLGMHIDAIRDDRPLAVREVIWSNWADHSRMPHKISSIRTTANTFFESNLRDLDDHIRNTDPIQHHITYSTGRAHYKFIEHMLLKHRKRELQPSHMERLLDIPFTWGSQRQGPVELFADHGKYGGVDDPSIRRLISFFAEECPHCSASFGVGSAWKVKPRLP